MNLVYDHDADGFFWEYACSDSLFVSQCFDTSFEAWDALRGNNIVWHRTSCEF